MWEVGSFKGDSSLGHWGVKVNMFEAIIQTPVIGSFSNLNRLARELGLSFFPKQKIEHPTETKKNDLEVSTH